MSAVSFSSKHWTVFDANRHGHSGDFAALIGRPGANRGKHTTIKADGSVTYFKTYATPEHGRATPGLMFEIETKAGLNAAQALQNRQARATALADAPPLPTNAPRPTAPAKQAPPARATASTPRLTGGTEFYRRLPTGSRDYSPASALFGEGLNR
jgi:hypothetical protein